MPSKPAARKREPLDARTLRAVAKWHREQFRKSQYPSGWEAHLISYERFMKQARALESRTKPKRAAAGKGRRE